jgi:flagellar hook-associated protein 2
MAITAAGTGSGIDIEGLISQLVAAEAEPTNARFNRREADLQAELSAFGTLKSALSSFQTSVASLESGDTFQVYTAASSNEDLFTATSANGAVGGSYDIEITQLAQSEQARSGFFTDSTEVMGTGTLDITLGADSFQVTIDGTNNTLENIRDAINAASDNPGITASLINVDAGTQLILTSDTVGATNTINVVAVDDALDGFDLTRLDSANLTTSKMATDAIIEVDGQVVTRDSNSFSDVITGVTLNLAQAAPGTVETLTIALDSSAITGSIESFVNEYNTLIGVMKGLSNFDESTNVSGALNGNAVVRGIQSSLRDTLFAGVSGGAFSNLTELGITLDDTGSLVIDNATLTEKLSTQLSDVESFFTATGGLAQAFSTAIEGYEQDDGIIEGRQDSLESRIDNIDDDRDTLARRMVALEARLRAQFTAMDILVAQLRSTSNFLTSQLASLPEPNSINRR